MCVWIADKHISKFNQTCCELKGVPEECMGLCREKRQDFRTRMMPMDRCAEHKDAIKSCVYDHSEY